MNRRDLLAHMGMLGTLGVSRALLPGWLPQLAFRSLELSATSGAAPGDTLICIFLRGGMDGLSAVVPYGEGSHFYDARPTQRVREPGNASGAALDLDGFFGLHPALAPLEDIYRTGDLGVVHAVGSTDPSRSHFDAMQFMENGTPGTKMTGTGWLGRHLKSAAWENGSPFRAVGMGAMLPASLRGGTPLSLRSIADFHLRGRQGEVGRMERMLSDLYTLHTPDEMLGPQANLVFETVEMLKSLEAPTYQPAGGASYPDDHHGFGKGLEQIAQLIKAEVGLEVACLDLGGWDTHEGQGTLDGNFNYLLDTLGRGLEALYTDLGDRMQRVTVITMSEFGRRVRENASAGTDHGHGGVMMLMGGGVKGGQVYSQWPTLEPHALNNGDLAVTTDYRDVLAEVVAQRLGNPKLAEIFPNHTVTPLGLVHPLDDRQARV